MKTALLLLSFFQIDHSSRLADETHLPPAPEIPAPTSATPARAVQKPVVTIYGPKSWRCGVCERWKRYDTSNEPFAFEFKAKDQANWTQYPVFRVGDDWYYAMTIEQVRRKVAALTK